MTWATDCPEEGREAAGFRNHFDIAFDSLGELFTFDSDMELQEFLPFYVPIRVCHCPPGAEFGWRSNSGKWPPWLGSDSAGAVEHSGRHDHRQGEKGRDRK